MCLLDYNTVAAADKFGNVYVLRLPEGVNDNVEVASGARQLWDLGILSGAPIKLECSTHYFLGEVVTSLVKRAMVVGGPEILIASTITGGLFALVPFVAKDEVTFFQHLEMFVRQELVGLCQRDHMSYRSYYLPVKHTIDGDLCERFASLPLSKQKEFATDVDRTPAEVLKKLEDARNIM
jgi:splicing factor 3B subunit 3